MRTVHLVGIAAAHGLALGMVGCVTSRHEGAVGTGTRVLNKNVPWVTEHNELVHIRQEAREPNYGNQPADGNKAADGKAADPKQEGREPKYETRKYDYKVLFGPYPPGKGKEGSGQFEQSDPTWHVTEGYVFAWGWWPLIMTNIVIASSSSTVIVVEVNPGGFDRVYLLHPEGDTSVMVRDKDFPPTGPGVILSGGSVYVQANPEGGNVTYTEVRPIPTTAGDPVCEFIKYVIDQAQAAGYTGPDWECTAAGN